ncbi:MAG: sulfurtransferase [Minwuia sp.]|nr:sulfurtransferase [Minwuia sp.]
MTERSERWLISTEQLAAQLGDPDLRVLDCSTRLAPATETTFRVEPCRAEWEASHIPGAGFIDIQGDLSRPDPKLRFTLPDAASFAAAAGRLGIGDDSRIVLYSRFHPMWATRVWWMLRAFGFDNAAILDGGIDKWEAEGRATESGTAEYPPAIFTARPRPELIADQKRVQAAMTENGTIILNALGRDQHTGSGGTHYGRPGHIAGSVNVPAREMTDPKTRAFLPLPQLEKMLKEVGVDGSAPVVTYCGGGIAATTPAFVMALLGHDDVALYDNSLTEWCMDPNLPMETDT